PTFLHLLETGHDVVALVTQPDRPQGRKQELIPSRIKQAAIERGVPVEQPEDVNAPESLERIRSFHPDLLVTAAYGQILSAGVLEDRLAGIGAPLVAESIAAIIAGTARVIPQDKARVTRAPKLTKEDGRIDWTQPARVVHNLVRALKPWPIASATWHPAEVG